MIDKIKNWFSPENRQTAVYQATLLGGVALLTSAVIAVGDALTRSDIAKRQAESRQAFLRQVIPPDLHDNDLLADAMTIASGGTSVVVYPARRDGKTHAVAYEVYANGYGSTTIVSIMGVDRDGKILGVRVIKHAETPGLGDKLELSRSDWILSFNGRSLTDPDAAGWAVKKEGGIFDQFTGATITPRSVIKSVKEGLDFFVAHRDELLAMPSGTDQ